MARFGIGLNEGSLLRRTLLHVATFVVGSVAIVGLTSLLLVSVVKGLTHPASGADTASTADPQTESAPGAARATKGINKPGVRPRVETTRKDE